MKTFSDVASRYKICYSVIIVKRSSKASKDAAGELFTASLNACAVCCGMCGSVK